MNVLYEEMLAEYKRRGLDGDALLRWAAWRVSHGGPQDPAEHFLLMMADLEYLARIRIENHRSDHTTGSQAPDLKIQ